MSRRLIGVLVTGGILAVVIVAAFSTTSFGFQVPRASSLANGGPQGQMQVFTVASSDPTKKPGLTVLNVTWSIDPTQQIVKAIALFVQPATPPKQNVQYHIGVFVSCQNLRTGQVFTCSSGRGVVTFGSSNTLPSPRGFSINLLRTIDPENSEIHDLRFVVSSSP